jgi:hypothetical protein
MKHSPQTHRGTEKSAAGLRRDCHYPFLGSNPRFVIPFLLVSLCLCVSVVNAQTPTNLGPIQVTTTDVIGQTAAPPNPPAGTCRAYYNSTTGVTTWINSVGSPCGPSVGSCPNCVTTDGSGNATITGDFTALELILSGLGPLDLVTPCNTVSAPPGGYGLWGMGSGCVPVIYPSTLSAVVPVAYQDGFGNVYQNANTATALAATPAQCSGQYALGITATGAANCSSSTYVFIPEIAAPSGTSGYGSLWFDSTAHWLEFRDGTGTVQTPLAKSTAYMTWTCPVSSQIANQLYCIWTTPTAGVTVVALDFGNAGAPTCVTYPTFEVWDGTASAEVGSFAITINGSTNFFTQVTGSTAVTGGHVLQIKELSGATCTGGTGAVATITYQMS